MPPANQAVRARLERERLDYGNQALHARLAQVDPTSAQRIHPNDPQRVQRALEVYELSGQSLTELYVQKNHKALPFPLLRLALAPSDRHWLQRRIDQRFRQMLEQGFVNEVEKLRVRKDLDAGKPAMRAVGYRQVWNYLDGAMDYEDMIMRGIIATRQFAKRQLTWLRSETDVIWLDMLQPNLLDRVMKQLDKYPWVESSFCRDQ